jgi:predicted DNA-binding protein
MKSKNLSHHIRIRLNQTQFERLRRLLVIEQKTTSHLLREIIESYIPKLPIS